MAKRKHKTQQPGYPEFKLEKEGLVVYHLHSPRETVSIFSAKQALGGNTDWYLSLNGALGTQIKVTLTDDGFVVPISQLPSGLQEKVTKKGGGLLVPVTPGMIYRIQV